MKPHAPRTRRYYLPVCTLILLLLSFEGAYAQDTQPTPVFTLTDSNGAAVSNVALRAGRSATVKVSSTAALAEADVTPTADPDTILNISKRQDTSQSVLLTLTAKQQMSDAKVDVKVDVKVGDKTLPLTVSVQPFIKDAADLAADLPNLPDTLTLKRDEPKVIPVAIGGMQEADLRLTSTDEKVVTATFDGQQLKIRAAGPGGPAQVTLSNAAKVPLKQITVTVKESPEFVRLDRTEITLPTAATTDVDWTTQVRLLGRDGDVTAALKGDLTPVSKNPGVLSADPSTKMLRALKKGTAQLQFVAPDGRVIGPVFVTVNASPEKLRFTFSTGNTILRPNQNVRVTANVENTAGETADAARVARWEYFDDADTGNESKLRITFAEEAGTNVVSVTALADAPVGKAKLKAFFGPNASLSDVVTFTIQRFEVTDFKPLQIRLDMLDEQTTRDLFGKKASDEFYVAKIRLYNNLRDPANTGNSILIYGESLEVNVALEINEGKGNGWQKLDDDEKFKGLFGTTDPNAPDLIHENPPNLICPARRTKQPHFLARYRPMTFEMIANTHDRRDERSLRSKILQGLNTAGSLTSFVTSIAVPGPSSDLPLGLEKFRNFFIPGFERLFPSMREVQRQNILSMVLRPLEEVPFGSDITRIVFFPRRAIRGVVPQGEARIGAISISDACAEVAIIKKTNQP